MSSVEVENAVMRERARIRKEVCDLATARIGKSMPMVPRGQVLNIIRNSKPDDHEHQPST